MSRLWDDLLLSFTQLPPSPSVNFLILLPLPLSLFLSSISRFHISPWARYWIPASLALSCASSLPLQAHWHEHWTGLKPMTQLTQSHHCSICIWHKSRPAYVTAQKSDQKNSENSGRREFRKRRLQKQLNKQKYKTWHQSLIDQSFKLSKSYKIKDKIIRTSRQSKKNEKKGKCKIHE